ncbi:hypothetical protein [Streptomyces sp. NPDC053560]
MTQHCSAHDARTCRWCAPLRHPSQVRVRRALAAIPRQTRSAASTGGVQ